MDASDKKRKRKRAERRAADAERARLRKDVRREIRPEIIKRPDPFAEAARQADRPSYMLAAPKKTIASHYEGLRDALREVEDLARKLPVRRFSFKTLPLQEAVKPALAAIDKDEFRRGPQHGDTSPQRLRMAREFRTEPDRVDHSPKRVRAGKICKPRPDNSRSRNSGRGGGSSPKEFIPWCDNT